MPALALARLGLPREEVEMEQIIADFGLYSRPILSFLVAKLTF
jgi:hypothetical protein